MLTCIWTHIFVLKGAVSPILEDPESTFASDILKYLQLELRGAKNIYKLLDSINVLCQLIQVSASFCIPFIYILDSTWSDLWLLVYTCLDMFSIFL